MCNFSSDQLDFLVAILDKMHRSSRSKLAELIPDLSRYKHIDGPDERDCLTDGVYSSISDLYAYDSGLDIQAATIKLAHHFGHSPELCFCDNVTIGGKGLHLCQEELSTQDIGHEIPATFCLEKNNYTCFHIHKLLASNGKPGGYFAIYSLNDVKFLTVPFFIKHDLIDGYIYHPVGSIKLGINGSHKRLTGEDQLRKYSQATVLLFEDPVVAACVEKMIHAADGLVRPEDYVVSTWFGGSEMAPYIKPGALSGRNVCFVPKPFDENFSRAMEYKKTLGVDVVNWKICPLPIAYADITHPNLQSDWGKDNLYCSQAIIHPRDYSIVAAIVNSSMPLENYEEWQKDTALSADSLATGVAPLLSKPVQKIIQMRKSLSVDQSPTLSDVISPGKITIILGHSDSGKSTVALHMLAALYLRKGIFCLRPGRRSLTSLLIDSETNQDIFSRRFARLETANPKEDLSNLALSVFLQRDSSSELDIDLTNETHRQRLELEIKNTRPDVVWFDSLSKMCSRHKLPVQWPVLVQWLVSLERKYGVAIVICHHTAKDGDASGTTQIEDFAQNIFKIESPRSPKTKLSEKEKEAFERYEPVSGVLVKLTVQKCKLLPSLTHKQFGYFLPENPESDNPGWTSIPLGDEMEDGADPAQGQMSRMSQLPEGLDKREQQVMGYAFQHDEFRRADIDELLKVKRSTSGKTLLALVNRGLLTKKHQGKDYVYLAIDQSETEKLLPLSE